MPEKQWHADSLATLVIYLKLESSKIPDVSKHSYLYGLEKHITHKLLLHPIYRFITDRFVMIFWRDLLLVVQISLNI